MVMHTSKVMPPQDQQIFHTGICHLLAHQNDHSRNVSSICYLRGDNFRKAITHLFRTMIRKTRNGPQCQGTCLPSTTNFRCLALNSTFNNKGMAQIHHETLFLQSSSLVMIRKSGSNLRVRASRHKVNVSSSIGRPFGPISTPCNTNN